MSDMRQRAQHVAEHTGYDEDVVLSLLTAEPFYFDHMDDDELTAWITDKYNGEYENEKDFAQLWASEVSGYKFGDEPWPYDCIDWDEATLLLMQDFFSVDSLVSGGVHIFWNH